MKHQHLICNCRDCKRMKRHGFILGANILRHFANGGKPADPNHHGCNSESAYVPYFRWQKGRRPEVK